MEEKDSNISQVSDIETTPPHTFHITLVHKQDYCIRAIDSIFHSGQIQRQQIKFHFLFAISLSHSPYICTTVSRKMPAQVDLPWTIISPTLGHTNIHYWQLLSTLPTDNLYCLHYMTASNLFSTWITFIGTKWLNSLPPLEKSF